MVAASAACAKGLGLRLREGGLLERVPIEARDPVTRGQPWVGRMPRGTTGLGSGTLPLDLTLPGNKAANFNRTSTFTGVAGLIT